MLAMGLALCAGARHLETIMRFPSSDAAFGAGTALSTLVPRVLDELDYGVMLVEPSDSRLAIANRAARRECADGRTLRLTGEQLHAARTADAAALAVALIDAVRERRSLLTLGAADARLSLAVIPMSAPARPRTQALVILGRRRLCETLSVEMFARRHGLTGAETNVLRALCDGLRPADIAARFGVRLATVRTQVGAIRSKTAAASIRDVVHRVAALPPIVPAPHDALGA
jgi:DNA-binding CsgD family transcriptional regulator